MVREVMAAMAVAALAGAALAQQTGEPYPNVKSPGTPVQASPAPWPRVGTSPPPTPTPTPTPTPRPTPTPAPTPAPAPWPTPAPTPPTTPTTPTASPAPAPASPVTPVHPTPLAPLATPLPTAPPAPPAATGPAVEALPPVPPKNACQSALTAIVKEHEAEYADRAPLAKQALAGKLILEAHGMTDASPRRYMLLHEAARLAATIADFGQVRQAVADLRGLFAIDYEATMLELCDTMAPVPKPAAQQRTLSLVYAELVPLAWAREDFASAGKYNTRALNMARVANDTALAAAATTRAADIAEAEQAFPETLLARGKLLDTPDDAAANGVVGRFLCLYKGDFDAGLPHLAKSNLPDLKDLALHDLALKTAGADDPLSVLAVAEAWRVLGDKAAGLVRRNELLHARLGYQQFLTNEEALRGRIQSSVQKIDTEFPALPTSTGTAPGASQPGAP